MNRQSPNIVWRADIAVQGAARDSSSQGSAALQRMSVAANWWGGPGIIWFGAVLWLGGRTLKRTTVARIGLRGAEGLAIASALSAIIKGFAGRARPFVTPGEPWHWEFAHGWSDAHFFSMPSGHTTATTAFAVGVLLATRGIGVSQRVALVVPLIASAGAVAFARVYTDQHWLSDVLAAVVLGTVTSVVLARIHTRTRGDGYHRVMLGAAAASPVAPVA